MKKQNEYEKRFLSRGKATSFWVSTYKTYVFLIYPKNKSIIFNDQDIKRFIDWDSNGQCPYVTDDSTTWGGRCVDYYKKDEYHGIVIALKDYPKCNLDTLCTLTHEVNHATEYIFDFIGMKHNEHTSEAYAYLHASIYANLLNTFLPKKMLT